MGALELMTGGLAASAFPGSSVTMPNMVNLGGAFPGLDGPRGAMAQMVMQPMLQQLLGPSYAAGQFAPQGNLYDFYRQQQQFASMQQATRSAAEVDRGTYVRAAQGMAGMMGLRFNDDRARAARVMAQDISAVTPMLAQIMPETLDRLHGSRGSAQVMAQQLFMGGRYMHDPVTGRQGLSGDTISTITERARGMFWGPGADPGQFGGLSAGRVGSLVDELARRGSMAPAMRRDQMLREIATGEVSRRAPGLQGAAMDREINTTMERLDKIGGNELRNFQSDRILGRVKELSKVVSAMQDIFGSLGRPDAPMTELINGLQVLTQGGLQNMSGRQMEDTVRNVANLARRTGLGMDNATALVAAGGQRAADLGLNRVFGASAAQGSMAFGQAFGVLEGGLQGFGRPTKEQMVALDQRLRLGAANSADANQLGALMRMVDTGMVSPKAGSQLEAMVGALRQGRSEYTFNGQTTSTFMRGGQFVDMLARSGVNPNLAQSMISQTAANQGAIFQYGLADVSRRNQASQAGDLVRDIYSGVAVQAGVRDRGMARQIGEIASSGLLDEMSPEDAQNPGKMFDRMKSVLQQRGVAVTPAMERQLRQVAQLGRGGVLQAVQRSPVLRSLYGTGEAFLAANRRGNLDEADMVRAEAALETRFQSALGGLGRNSPMQRVADALLEAGPGTSAKDVLAKVMGFEPTDKVAAALRDPMEEVRRGMANYQDLDKTIDTEAASVRDLQARIGVEIDPKKRAAMQALLSQKLRGAGITDARHYTDKRFRTGLRARRGTEILGMLEKSVGGLNKAATDAGIDLRGAGAVNEIAQAQSLMAEGKAGGISEMSDITQAILHDEHSMNRLGKGGLGLARGVLEQTGAIQSAAAAAGMTVDDFIRTDSGSKMFKAFRASSEEVRSRLANPSKQGVGEVERRQIAEYNKLRTEGPKDTMERVRKSLGLGLGAFDPALRDAKAAGAFAGMSGAALRDASMSMGELRKMAALGFGKKEGDITSQDMDAYFLGLEHKRRAGGLSAEEEKHFMAATAGTGSAKRGLAGLSSGKITSERTLDALKDFQLAGDAGTIAAKRMARALGMDPASITKEGLGLGKNAEGILASADALQSLRGRLKLDDKGMKDYLSKTKASEIKDDEERALFETATKGMGGKVLAEAVGDKGKLRRVMEQMAKAESEKPVRLAPSQITGTIKIEAGADHGQLAGVIQAGGAGVA